MRKINSDIVCLKIAIIIPTLDGGGAERSMVYLANGLASSGFDIHLVVALNADGVYKKESGDGVTLFDLKAARFRYVPYKLHKYMRKHKPNIIVTALMNDWVLAMKLIMGYSAKVIISERIAFSEFFGKQPGFMVKSTVFLSHKLYPHADRIVGVSRGVSEDLLKIGLARNDQIRTIYNSVVNDQFFRMLEEKPSMPLLHGEIPNFIAVGRLAYQKNYPVLLNAFALVRKNRPCRLIIMGEGLLRSSMERQVKSLGLQNDVLMPGFIGNPFPYMSGADCFVLASKFEGLPGVLIQALACGVMPVSTDCPSGPAEILENGKYGILVPVDDADALADGMEKALTNPLPPELLKERSRAFSEENCVSAYIDLFNELML
jgi:glycosyltransferase involved in cell wall biosynthesis